MPAFDTYDIVHFSKHPYVAQINCFAAGVHVGMLNFYRDDAPLPPNVNSTPPTINFPASQLANVIGTMRYDKPLQFNFNPANLIGSIGTSTTEPVGEQEG